MFYLFLKIIKEVSSQIYLQQPIVLRQQRLVYYWSEVQKQKQKTEKNCYELMDEIKFSHCITNKLFRNTSLRVVDTILDFTTMKLKSHS